MRKLFEILNGKDDFGVKFQWLKRGDYERVGTVWIDPMLAKSADMNNEYLATQLFESPDWCVQHKLNGERATFHIHKKYNRMFSRRVSVESDWLNEKTDLIPHLRDTDFSQFAGTILDGELLHPSGEFKRIGRVMRSLDKRAWRLQQEDGWLFYVVYDVIQWKGFDVRHLPYRDRLKLIQKFCYNKGLYRSPFVQPIITVYNGITIDGVFHTREGFLKYILSNKGEGCIYKRLDAPYVEGMQYSERVGKMTEYRSPNMLKVKDVDTWDVVICGYDHSLSLYGGKQIEEDGYWEYWIDKLGNVVPHSIILNSSVMISKGYRPVTRFYAKGWINTVKYGVCVPFDELESLPEPLQDAKIKKYKDNLYIVEVGQCSGMSDVIREELTKHESEHMFQVIEVTANELTDKETGGLRHPRFSRYRYDKSPEQCTWKSHIRES